MPAGRTGCRAGWRIDKTGIRRLTGDGLPAGRTGCRTGRGIRRRGQGLTNCRWVAIGGRATAGVSPTGRVVEFAKRPRRTARATNRAIRIHIVATAAVCFALLELHRPLLQLLCRRLDLLRAGLDLLRAGLDLLRPSLNLLRSHLDLRHPLLQLTGALDQTALTSLNLTGAPVVADVVSIVVRPWQAAVLIVHGATVEFLDIAVGAVPETIGRENGVILLA